MRYLIDTHVFLCMVDRYENLSEKVKYILLDTDNELYFSKVSYWEICVKQSIGKLKLESGWERRFEREIQENQIRWIEVEKNTLKD